MIKARRVFTSFGEVFFTERGNGACCSGDEVASVDVLVPKGTLCGICEKEIAEPPETK